MGARKESHRLIQAGKSSVILPVMRREKLYFTMIYSSTPTSRTFVNTTAKLLHMGGQKVARSLTSLVHAIAVVFMGVKELRVATCTRKHGTVLVP